MGKNNNKAWSNFESYEVSRVGARVNTELRHLASSHYKTSKSLEKFLSGIVDCQEGGYVICADPIQVEYISQIADLYKELNQLLKAANSYGNRPITPNDIPSNIRKELRKIKDDPMNIMKN